MKEEEKKSLMIFVTKLTIIYLLTVTFERWIERGGKNIIFFLSIFIFKNENFKICLNGGGFD